MTTLRSFRTLTLAAAPVLLLAPVHPAEDRGGGARMAFGSVTTGAAKPTAPPVVRDHRERPTWSRQRCGLQACPWRSR